MVLDWITCLDPASGNIFELEIVGKATNLF